MKVSVLLENATPSSRFVARHGLSLFLEVERSAGPFRMLFDFGPDESFLANAHMLGIDVSTADAAVLSHGHYDHGGGLRAFLDATVSSPQPVPVYVREHAFEHHVSGTPVRHHSIGVDPALAVSSRVVVLGEKSAPDRLDAPSKGAYEIAPGLALFACADRPHPAPASNRRLLTERGGSFERDAFLHEQSLLVTEGARHILVSGCSHAGILNIIERAEKLCGAPLDAVVAGFHLVSPSAGTGEAAEATRALARSLANRPTRYYTFHCTGIDAYSLLRDELGDRIGYLSCGTQAEI